MLAVALAKRSLASPPRLSNGSMKTTFYAVQSLRSLRDAKHKTPTAAITAIAHKQFVIVPNKIYGFSLISYNHSLYRFYIFP